MTSKLLNAQYLACGLLAVVAVLEWVYGQYAQQHLLAAINAPVSSDYAEETIPSLTAIQTELLTSNQLVERPLFIEGRKPLIQESEISAPQATDLGQLEDWALIGVYLKDKQQTALFSKVNEAKKYLKIKEQQSIAGWKLKEIQSDRVILLNHSGQTQSLMLRKPRAQHLPPPAANKLNNRPRPLAVPVPQQPNNVPENINNESQTN